MWPSLMERGSQPALDHTHTPDVPPVRTVTFSSAPAAWRRRT